MQVISGIQQSVFDIALQYHGSIESVFDITKANNLSIDEAVPGNLLLTMSDKPINRMIVDYYKENGIKPSTGFVEGQLQEGIGYWAIGVEFIIN